MAEQSYPGAAPPPPGVIPNLAYPHDAGRRLNIAVMITVDVLVLTFLATRLITKFYISRRFLVEDATCIIGACLILFYSATVFLMTHYGHGYHQWEISQADFDQVLKWLYASSIIYIPTAFFVKTTLLLLIARVFAVRRKVARGIHYFIAFIAIAYAPIQFCKIFICTPIRAYWQFHTDGSCLQQRKIFLADLSIAIFTDLVILIIPVPLTWSLKMPWKKKLKIVILLAGGGFATATTIFRLCKAVEFIDSQDVTHDFVALDCLTITEVAIGFICSCVPSANLLFQRLKRSIRPAHHHNTAHRRREHDAEVDAITPSTKSLNFKAELALWSGVRDDTPSQEEQEEQEEAGRATRGSFSSGDGRREGWLAPPEPAARAASTREISMELSRVSRNEPWEHIWDGRAKR